MAHGCASSAWTLGFYTLHNWMLALFGEQAQEEAFATRPFLAPAPLAPTGRGVPVDGGIRLTGRWSWATGVMDGNWMIVGALCGPDDGIYPALALLPIGDVDIEDVWHTDGMCATGSNDVIISDAFVPDHRLVNVVDIYGGTAPGAALHDAPRIAGRWCLRWRCWRRCPHSAAPNASPTSTPTGCPNECWPTRASHRRTNPSRRPTSARRGCGCAHCAGCSTTPRPARNIVAAGDPVPRPVRGKARLAAAHIVHESRARDRRLLEASGASAQFLNNPMQRMKRDVDVLAGHVVFDYDTSRELAGALILGMDVPRTAMV